MTFTPSEECSLQSSLRFQSYLHHIRHFEVRGNFLNTLFWWSARWTLGDVIFSSISFSLVIHSQKIFVRGRTGGGGRGVGLVIEPELHVIRQNLIRRSLVSIQQQCCVRTTWETSLVSVNPTSWILLLNKITYKSLVFWLIKCECLPFGSSRQFLWKGTPLSDPLIPPSQIQVGASTVDILIVEPDLSVGPWYA